MESPYQIEEKTFIDYHFFNGPNIYLNNPKEGQILEVSGRDGFHQKFIPDPSKKKEHYSIPHTYENGWIIILRKDNEILERIEFNPAGGKVAIHFGSRSLGDMLGWVPYCLDFKERFKCDIVATTFHNELFESQYPEIEFQPVGSYLEGIYATFNVGLYLTEDGGSLREDRHPKNSGMNVPMQKICTDILGLEFRELKPRVKLKFQQRPIENKYVCIAPNSTMQAKYWNHPEGWQLITDYLIDKGYDVVISSREEDGFMGNNYPKGAIRQESYMMDSTMNYIHHSDLFIGLGSGLSWLAWALDKHVIMISGFSKPYTEFQTGITRLIPPSGSCSGCFNEESFSRVDWNWCPEHKDTDRQFECSKLITPINVIDAINEQLSIDASLDIEPNVDLIKPTINKTVIDPMIVSFPEGSEYVVNINSETRTITFK